MNDENLVRKTVTDIITISCLRKQYHTQQYLKEQTYLIVIAVKNFKMQLDVRRRNTIV